MSRPRKTVPVTSGVKSPEFTIANWPAIEAACKFNSSFEPEIQNDIGEATLRYLCLEAMETQASPSNKIRDELLEIASGAERLRLRLEPLTRAVSPQKAKIDLIELDPGFQILHRLGRHFDGSDTFRSISSSDRKRPPDIMKELKALYDILCPLEEAAKNASNSMQQEVGAQLAGESWSKWVFELHSIMTNAGMSPTTSNDTDKRLSTETPFLRLIKELQSLLPLRARRPLHSDSAFAKAIQRAIEKNRHPPKLSAA